MAHFSPMITVAVFILILPLTLAFDYSNAPLLNVRINQTSSGKFIIHFPGEKAEKNMLMNFTSLWMQDDLNKQLYISVGEKDYGDNICFANYWFLGRKTYELTYTSSKCDGPVECTCVDGFGYDEEVDHYNSTYMAWVDSFKSDKYGNRNVGFYTGRMEDGVGKMTNSIFVDLDQNAFLGLVVHETQEVTDGRKNIAYFREYIYDNVTMVQPNPRYFEIPQECKKYEVETGCKKASKNVSKIKFLESLII